MTEPEMAVQARETHPPGAGARFKSHDDAPPAVVAKKRVKSVTDPRAEALAGATGSALAMIALRTSEPLDPAAVIARYGERWGEPLPSEVSHDGATMTLLLGDGLGFVAEMPVPIPEGDLDAPIRTAWWWRDAADRLADHQAHLIVGVSGQSGGTVEARLALFRLLAVVVELTDCAGVYWGDAELVQSPEAITSFAAGMENGILPVMLWVNIQVGPDLAAEEEGRPGRFAAFTTGMAAFGFMDVQVRDAAVDGRWLFETVHNLVGYSLGAETQINDGDTIGLSDADRILVRHMPSFMRAGETVLELILDESTDPATD